MSKDYPTGIHAPDWNRTLVQSQSTLKPVGDPTRWGTSTFTQLPQPDPVNFAVDASSQIILVATRDTYARSWALNGTITLPAPLWETFASPLPADLLIPLITLQVQMGVGQAQVLQEIVLYGQTDDGPIGLCSTQNAVAYGDIGIADPVTNVGGPYAAYATPSLKTTPIAGDFDLTYSFAAIGALIGSQINIRVRYQFQQIGNPVTQLACFPARSLLNAVLTPFAAGEGL